MLLNACVAKGLLSRDGDRYSNSLEASEFLVKGAPAYIGEALKYSEDLYEAWGRTVDLMQTGKPVAPHDLILGDDEEKTRNFVLGMHNRALGIGAALPQGADFAGRTRLLDVGGGPGTYSVLLTQKFPGLHATVLDLAPVLNITREIIERYAAADRVDTIAGNYMDGPYPGGFDSVLMSGMMHRETAEGCRVVLGHAYDALETGGMAVVSDVFFDNENRDSPWFSVHFALNMMLTSADGSAHSHPEMVAWMSESGFSDLVVRPLPAPNPHSLIVGFKT